MEKLLTDFFAGSPFEVELEKDLSRKKQILDVVILRKRQRRPSPAGSDWVREPEANFG